MGGGGSSYDKSVANLAHFNKEREVGRGGFGKVYAVTSKSNKKWYAMKEMSKKIIMASTFNLKMLENEKAIMVDLHKNPHPFIIEAHHTFQTNSHCYIILDCILGGDLRFYLKQNGKMKESVARFYLAQLVETLGFLHEKKILHRDIKVENVLMNDDGYIKLIDFGISAYLSDDGVCTMTSGTPFCLAPEIFGRSHKHSYSSDFFSAGLVLHRLMTGKDIFANKGRDPNTVASALRKLDCSDDCREFLQQVLSFDPEDRPGEEDGQHGHEAVKKMAFFNKVDFESLLAKKQKAPFIPNVRQANCDMGTENFEEQMMGGAEEAFSGSQDAFKDYEWNVNLLAEGEHAS